MAEVTVDLTGYTSLPTGIFWTDDVSLGSVFGINGEELTLTFVVLSDLGTVQIRVDGLIGAFTDDFVASGTFIIMASDDETLTVQIADADMTEPYFWTPTNRTDVIAFVTHIRGLTDPNAMLTLTDEDVATVPAVPAIALFNITSTSVDQQFFDSEPGELCQVRYRVTGTAFWTESPTTTSVVLTVIGLTPNTGHDIQARCSNDSGPSAWSSTSTFTTLDTPSTSINHTVNAGDASWTFAIPQVAVTHIPTTGEQLPDWISSGSGSPTDPYIIIDPLDINNRSILDLMLSGRGNVNNEDGRAQATHFQFIPPVGYSGNWTISLDTTPSEVDMDLAEADGTPSSITGSGDESYTLSLTMGAPYIFLVIRYASTNSNESSITGVTALTLTLEFSPAVTIDHTVNAGAASWIFTIPQPTITHVLVVPTTVNHTVDVGTASWSFDVPQPTITHVEVGAPDSLTFLWTSNGEGVFANVGLKDTTWTAPDVSQETIVTLTLLVTDLEGLTDTDSVDVTVSAPAPPTIDHTVNAGTAFWSFTIPEPTVTYVEAQPSIVIRLDSLNALDAVFTRFDTGIILGAWLVDTGGSTFSSNTGPGNNSAAPYVYSESTQSTDTLPEISTLTALATVMDAWLGNGRILALRACIQGEGTYPNDSASGLQIQGRGSDSDDWATIDLLEGWAYSNSLEPGDTIMDSLGVNRVVAQAGGWVDFEVTIPNTHTQLRIRNIPAMVGEPFRHDAAMWHIEFRNGTTTPSFVDHMVDAGVASWSFDVPQPTITYVPIATPDFLTYIWSSNGGGVFSNAGLKDTTWTSPDVAQNTIVTLTLLVTDSGGLTDSDNVNITVQAVVIPVNHTVDVGATSWSFDIPQSSITHVEAGIPSIDHAVDAGIVSWTFDVPQPTITHGLVVPPPTPDILTYLWMSNGGGVFADIDLKDTTWTAPDVVQETIVTLTLLVTDSGGLTDTNSVTVTVRAAIPTLTLVDWIQPVSTENLVLALVEAAVSGVDITASPMDLVGTGNDVVVAVDLSIDQIERQISPILRLRKTGAANLSFYFGDNATYPDAKVYIQTANAVVPFTHNNSGGGFSNWNIDDASQEVIITAIATGDQFILAITIPLADVPIAHAVDVSDINWSFDVPSVTVTHVSAIVPPPPTPDTLTYLWSSNSGGVFADNRLKDTSWTAPDVDQETVVTLTLLVTDSEGLTDTDSVMVTVRASSINHVIDAGDASWSFTIPQVSVTNITPTGTDHIVNPEIVFWSFDIPEVSVTHVIPSTTDTLTYLWSSNAGGIFTNNALKDTTWIAPNVTQETVVTLTLLVTNLLGLTATDSIDVTVLIAPPFVRHFSRKLSNNWRTLKLHRKTNNIWREVKLWYRVNGIWVQVSGPSN